MKKLLKWYNNLSVTWKFVSTYFIILTLQIILSGVYLYIQASNSTINEAKLVMEQNLMMIRSSILQKSQVIENISPIITYDKSIQNFLDLKYENEVYQIEDYQFQFTPIIENIIRQNNILSSIRIYMSNAIFTEMRDSFYSASNKISSELYGKMLKGKPLKNGWKSTHRSYNYSYNSSEDVFSFNSEITSGTSYKNIGALEIEIKENVLFDVLRDPIVSKFGNVFIVDNKGTIVSSNIPKLFNKNVSSSGVVNFIK